MDLVEDSRDAVRWVILADQSMYIVDGRVDYYFSASDKQKIIC